MNALRTGLLLLLAISSALPAVAQPVGNAATKAATNAAPRRGGFSAPPAPRNPVPILPALPAPKEVAFYATNDVPHGRVEVVHYPTTAGTDKRMHVYLPPGYGTEAERRYPVLYLNHGGGEDDSHWTAKGFTQCILDQTNINTRFRLPIYFGVGETDIAYLNSLRTMAVFNDHGIRTFSVLSSHGHEWLNWRRYLWQTAQIMFPEDQ